MATNSSFLLTTRMIGNASHDNRRERRSEVRIGTVMFKAIVVAMLIVSGSPLSQQLPSSPVRMQDLTVPNERLPSGCSLKPGSPGASIGLRGTTANPWIGMDRRTIALIRRTLDGPPPLPDAAPLGAREASRFLLQLADGVEEGYAAIYAQSGTQDVTVYALKFATSEGTVFGRSRDDRTPRGQTRTRVALGPMVAIVYGNGGQCFEAIQAHLQSLGK